MTKIPKYHIPELPARNLQIGKEGILKRSFSTAPGEFIRILKNSFLILEIEFPQAKSASAAASLYTDFNTAGSEWKEYPLKKSGNKFKFRMKAELCGIFRAKVKYTLDQGKQWFLDRTPFLIIHVDPPGVRDLRMYTLLPNAAGDINAWTRHLHHIAAMKFNCVHLLPITHLDVSESPYSAYDLFSLDPAYCPHDKKNGGLRSFEKFVKAAVQKKIGICIDLVLNHIGFQSRMARQCPDWIVPDKNEPDGFKRSGCWHMNSWIKWEDLLKIYYDHPNEQTRREIWDYMTDYALFWAGFAHTTGGMIRLDNLHNSDEKFVAHLLAALRKKYQNLIIHAEFFSDANTIIKRAMEWDVNLFLANQWEYPYAENLRTYIEYLHTIAGKVQYYMPVTTHDTGVPAELYGSAEAVIPRYLITALMGCGKTGIVQGVEYGVRKKVEFIGRNRCIDGQFNLRLIEKITAINSLLAGEDLFHQYGNIKFIDSAHGAVVCAFRYNENGAGFIAAANLDIKNSYQQIFDIKAVSVKDGKYEDAFGYGKAWVHNGILSFDIEPCGIRAFRI